MKKECKHDNIEPCAKNRKEERTNYYCKDCKRLLGYKFLEERKLKPLTSDKGTK